MRKGSNALCTNIYVAGGRIAANIARLGSIGAHQTAERVKVLHATINDRELIGGIFDVAFVSVHIKAFAVPSPAVQRTSYGAAGELERGFISVLGLYRARSFGGFGYVQLL